MKKAEVKVGGKYYANVSGARCEIQIEAERPRGGWDATNLATGKKILIKSAQRLQGEVDTKRGRAKATSEAAAQEAIAEPTEAIGSETSTAVAVLKKSRKAEASQTEATEDGEKRLSCIGAALKVLSESADPMNAQEMITAMEAKGYWTSPGGKTPHATLYSAILRELAKGDDSRFVKTERGRFTVRG